MHIHFGASYKQVISFLPASVVSLALGKSQAPITYLPPFLQDLSVSKLYNKKLPPLPSSLINIKSSMEALPDISHLSNLKKLRIYGVSNIFEPPPSTEVLEVDTVGIFFFETLPPALRVFRSYTCIPPVYLPPLLTHLELGDLFNLPVNNLPVSLVQLIFGASFNQPLDLLPASLTQLAFGNAFNQPVDHLPSSLAQLTFDHNFNQPVDHLPSLITHLSFGNSFNQAVDHLPPSLILIAFGSDFNRFVNYLPATLRHLHLGTQYNRQFFHPRSDLSLTRPGGCAAELLLPSITHLRFENKQSSDNTSPPSSQPEVFKFTNLSEYYYSCCEDETINKQFIFPKTFKQFTFKVNIPFWNHLQEKTCVHVNFETRVVHVSF